jgi:hypothetical protein
MLFGETVAVYCENPTEHTNTVCTSQETRYVSVTKINLLMLFGEKIAVYFKSHKRRLIHTKGTIQSFNVLK